MTLMTDDIGRLFAIMQSNYGNRWNLDSHAVGVWYEKLKRYDAETIMKAADAAIDHYLDWPPTIGQFQQICSPRAGSGPRYLPAPEIPKPETIANRLLFQMLKNVGGVDKATLADLLEVKRVECHKLDREPDDDFIAGIENMFADLMNGMDRDKRRAEREVARESFRVRQGMPQCR